MPFGIIYRCDFIGELHSCLIVSDLNKQLLSDPDCLQRMRVQKACELLESSNETIDVISFKVGYEDTGAFRKIFVKITGLTPKSFRNRFASA